MQKIKENQNIFDLIPDLAFLPEFLANNDLPLNTRLPVGIEYIGEETTFANSYIDNENPNNWILYSGTWQDYGIWSDSDYWIDN